MRDRVGMVDLSAFAIFDISGPGALDHVQAMAVTQMDVPVGRVVYTPLLNEAGGIKSDLTIMRLGADLFRVVTGGAHGMRDRKWFRDHLPADGSAQLYDATSTWCTAGVWGPRARDVVAVGRPRTTSRTRASRSGPRGPSSSAGSRSSPRGSRTSASSAGRSTSRWSRAPGCGTRCGRPGRRTASSRSGSACTATTGRLEKGYRAHGAELELDFDLVEADMLRPKVKEAAFIGRDAYLEQRVAAGGRHPVHPDRRRQHLGERGQALHARQGADPDPGRRPDHRRQGPPLVRDQRRLRPVGRQAHPAVVPAARATRWSARSSWSSTSASATR